MGELQVFRNAEFGNLRTIEIDNEAWILGKDVARALNYSDPVKAVRVHVDEDDKKSLFYKAHDKSADAFWDNQNDYSDKVLINESGIYSLIFSSKLPKAKEFKHWVTSEVLPSIRKNGGYIRNQENLTPEQIVANALIVANSIIAERDRQLAEAKPKVEFFDAVAGSKDAIPIGDVAKVLDMGLGRNKLFEFLRNDGILMGNNIPYQQYIDSGYFRTIEQKYTVPNGDVKISIKTLVYQKGVDFIRRRLNKVKGA